MAAAAAAVCEAHGRNCVRLAAENPILPLDSRIRFEEQEHTYYVDGCKHSGPSVTKLVKSCFRGEPFFDAHVVVQRHLASWRTKPKSKYYSLVQGLGDAEAEAAIRAQWQEANELGTLAHKLAEEICNGVALDPAEVARVPEEVAQLRAFFAEYDTLVPYRTELSLTYERPDGSTALVGQLDALFKCEHNGQNRFAIVDFKRVDKSLDPTEFDFGKSGIGPMEGVLGNDAHVYALQTHVYACMCRQHGIDVDACFLLQIHKNLPAFKLHRCVSLRAEAQAIVDAL